MTESNEADARKTTVLSSYLGMQTKKHWNVVAGSDGTKFECKEFEEEEARAMRKVVEKRGGYVRLIFQGRSSTLELDRPVVEKLFVADVKPAAGKQQAIWAAEAEAIRALHVGVS